MSKNTAIVIILILIAANALAALWKFGGLGHNELPEPDNLVTTNTASESDMVVDAELMKNVPDEFKNISDHAYFRTTEPVESIDGEFLHKYCAKRVSLQWPTAINGDKQLSNLHLELNKILFAENTDNVLLAIENAIHTPVFSGNSSHPYDVITKMPGNLSCMQLYSEDLSLTTYIKTNRFIEFCISTHIDNGSGTSAATTRSKTYVTYDKERGRVLQLRDVVTNQNDVLHLINDAIDTRNNRNSTNYSHASRIPGFCVEHNGLRFIFPEYELGNGTDNDVSIYISYDKLNSCLTPYFIEMICSSNPHTK